MTNSSKLRKLSLLSLSLTDQILNIKLPSQSKKRLQKTIREYGVNRIKEEQQQHFNVFSKNVKENVIHLGSIMS